MTSDLMSSLPPELADVAYRPGDEAYAAAATVYVRTGSPALVLRPRTVEQVAAAIHQAVAAGLPLSIRSGGHSVQAWGTNDGGLVIDMSAFAGVEVLDGDRVRVGAGARWGDVASTLGSHGLSLTSGDTRSVGVGGLTTGGGIGWMVRNHGLTIDSLVAADIVTADGRALHLTETENADLFWAIRGGGGNFGVLTSFEFVAQRVTTVHAGTIMYAPDDVPGLLDGWMDAHRNGPEELNSTLVFFPELGDPMPPAGLMGLVCYAGPTRPRRPPPSPLSCPSAPCGCRRSTRSRTPTCSRSPTRRRVSGRWRRTRSWSASTTGSWTRSTATTRAAPPSG